jgi:hypothetical protein
LPTGKVIRACNGFRYHRIRETVVDGRDRQCGEPLLISACLREVGDETDPAISSLRRSKAFPSLVGLGLPTLPASVVHFQEKESRPQVRTLRPVSQSTGFSTRTHLFGRVWGADIAAPILRCRGIYLVRKLGAPETDYISSDIGR